MSVFPKKHPPRNTYLQKYTDMAGRFQFSGGIIVLCSVILNYIGGAAVTTVSLLLFAAGAILLVIGGTSLRPHNIIKSFAQQCAREPGREIAEGLLEAMERNRKTALTKSSLQTIRMAVEIYATTADADPELLQKLQHALEHNLTKKIF